MPRKRHVMTSKFRVEMATLTQVDVTDCASATKETILSYKLQVEQVTCSRCWYITVSWFKNTVESVNLANRKQQKMAWRAQTFGKAYTQTCNWQSNAWKLMNATSLWTVVPLERNRLQTMPQKRHGKTSKFRVEMVTLTQVDATDCASATKETNTEL